MANTTYLPVDHMAHGNPQPHASTLDVVEIQMVKDGKHQCAGCKHRGIDISFLQCCGVIRVVVFKVINDFPQKYGLDHFGAFLKGNWERET